MNDFLNLKMMFVAARGIEPCGMKRALSLLGIPLDGQHHRGIDDARNITRILIAMLSENMVE
ncbi:hypothetical protein ACFL6M_00095 [Candidatus Eisenbacteria bacterium]|uniref:Exonuclease domain-containing protein n=1 Tax=Eiseniibacteriota bacterium TaxID=2212470 RepID=A0ABV6YI11_UNCEI